MKTVIGGWNSSTNLCDAVLRARPRVLRRISSPSTAARAAAGAAPQALAGPHGAADRRGAAAGRRDALIESGLRQRIRVIASGKLITSARAAWALCVGADFVNTARGFMFSLGCIQALRCHQNSCPTGVTTHNQRLQRGLVVEEKRLRVANTRPA